MGQKLDGLLRLLIGEATMALPPIAIGAGALIFLDSPVRRLRPLRLGVVTAMATLVLALSTTDTVEAEQHGGLIGAYARTLLEHLVGGVGVSILIALGTLAAIVLLTGASVGLVMRRSGQHVARAAGAGARLGGEVARRYRERPTGPPTLTAVPGGAEKRAKKAPAPLDGSQEYSDLFGDVPEFEIPGDEPGVAARGAGKRGAGGGRAGAVRRARGRRTRRRGGDRGGQARRAGRAAAAGHRAPRGRRSSTGCPRPASSSAARRAAAAARITSGCPASWWRRSPTSASRRA